jgi:hypothetical protein
VGKENFLAWRKQYPAPVTYRIRRITGHGDLWVNELLVSYNDAPPMFGVSLVEFRGDKIARETIYVMEAFEAATWRAAWVTRFDPLASVSPSEWTEGSNG